MLRKSATAAEILIWWAGLTALWAVLIGPADPLDLGVGAAAALVAACAARAARRAVTR
ncbi:hypothetical protein [Streptomyces sp. NPDC046261]|uniref:hypothetical protein n=1 Tax=Streptomyces sp. NPDC046261 TaxID=3157200 RepID=UPI003404F9FE